ncbi:hypothetical protein C8J56DRAFT_887027 [Mycena floridula]|nr:hypothetical protein C8J56DRAFT_887027 [Mycena floridula]
MSEVMQPGPLADSDILVLQEFLMIIAVQFVLHGIYSALAIIVLYKLWTKKAESAAHHILIVAVISMFVASTTQIILQGLGVYLIQLPTLRFDPPRPSINMDIFRATVTRLNYLIGDSIVVWRAWVLWTNHPRSKIFSYWPEDSRSNVTTVLDKLHFYSSYCIQSLDIIREYKVEIKQKLGLSPNKRTKVERVLILLAESGSIYCLLWAIYPIIIVLLLALEKDNLESTVNGQSFLQSLRFASRPQVPTVTQSDDVTPDSTTSHIDSVMPDPDTDDRPNPATDDRLDPTMDNRLDSKTNDIAVAEPLEEKMEKCSSSHFG